MARGDVFEAQLDPVEGHEQGGLRPVLIVSHDALAKANLVIVLPFSNAANFKKFYPGMYFVRAATAGLTVDSVALADQIRTISTNRLARYRGKMPDSDMQAIGEKLKMILALK